MNAPIPNLAQIDPKNLSRKEKIELLALLDQKIEKTTVNNAKKDLISFANDVYPGYTAGTHHKVMAKTFAQVISGEKKRVIINIAPRHGKSELTSYLFPAWFLGKFPDKKVIMATHTVSLSEDFGRRVRNLIDSADYQRIFPDIRLSSDSKSAGAWYTSDGGQYFAVGVGGALAGRGADLLVIDDPHSEQDARSGTKTVFEQAWSWYQTGPRQRLMWGGAVIVVMTRWGMLDLTAKLLEYQTRNPDADQWEVIEFPAILNEDTDKEKSLWPDKWPLAELKQTKASMEPRYWNSQYQQNPTADSSALIKRDHWRIWEDEDPPPCQFVIQTWDTAHDTKSNNDYSACQTWGVWSEEIQEGKDSGKFSPALILLDAFKERMEFPELKQVAYDHWKDWEPDALMIEKKAAGAPLIQELRSMGIPVQEFSPSRGNDKTVRVNAIADLFFSGKVWAPDTRWAREVIEELASFPVAAHDDYVDCCAMALLRFRQGRFVTLPTDWQDEPKKFRSNRHMGYY